MDKDFVKDLSSKLHEWTSQRWIISFSKKKGEMSMKEKELNLQIKLNENAKKTDLYQSMINHFPDAELIEVKSIKKDEE